MDKRTLRKMIREKAEKLTPDYRLQAGQIIAGKVISSEIFAKAETVFVYISMPLEPDTGQILEAAWKAGKRVCVPKCLDAHHMIAVAISSEKDLVPGRMNIPEPADCSAVVDPAEIDLGIIPCVSASGDGKRLGHGAGFYDLFLPQTGMYRMCICFSALISDEIPMEEHDLRMDAVITDALPDAAASAYR